MSMPELFAALAGAQAQVKTVGKDGTNDQARYNYATAEAMIRAGREALSAHGLCLLVSHTIASLPTSEADIGNQAVVGKVCATATLAHSSGGSIVSAHEISIIVSRRRPHDKAEMAALTYLHGFILRSLLNMDRAEEGSDAVDQRPDVDDGKPSSKPQTPASRQRADTRGSFDYDQRPRDHERPPPEPAEGPAEHYARLKLELDTIIASGRLDRVRVFDAAGVDATKPPSLGMLKLLIVKAKELDSEMNP